jgi:hypothetical protein
MSPEVPTRPLLVLGLFVIAIGVVLVLAGLRVLPLGRLPGDLTFERGSWRVYLPLGTSLLLSALLSLIALLVSRRGR